MRNHHMTALLLAVLPGLSLAGNPGPETPRVFTPNHLFVTSYFTDDVYEFDPAGVLVTTWDAGGELDGPEGLAFGPNGNLFVASAVTDEVVEIDPSGAVVRSYSHADVDSPKGVFFGPDGRLCVTSISGKKIVEFDLDGNHLRSSGGPGVFEATHQVAVGPDGHLFGADFVNDLLVEVDPSGTLVRSLGAAFLDGPLGTCYTPGGLLAISCLNADEVVFISSIGTKLTTFTDVKLAAPRMMAGGPDFTIYVASDATDRVISFLGSQFHRDVGANSGMDGPGAVAFAPFRFKGKLTGKSAGGSELMNVSQKVILSLAPGSYTVMVEFLEPEGGSGAYQNLFGADYFVGAGMEGVTAPGQKKRIYGGAEVSWPGMTAGAGSISLQVKGKVGAEQFYEPKQAAGDLHCSLGYVVLKGKLKTLKRL